jgi:hypothetical protein
VSGIPEDKLTKMDVARYLLEPPAPEVVGELIAEVRRLRGECAQAWKDNDTLRVKIGDLAAIRGQGWVSPEYHARVMEFARAAKDRLRHVRSAIEEGVPIHVELIRSALALAETAGIT